MSVDQPKRELSESMKKKVDKLSREVIDYNDDTYQVKSSSNPDDSHMVNYNWRKKVFECDIAYCKGFQYNGYCSHTLAVEEYLRVQEEIKKKKEELK